MFSYLSGKFFQMQILQVRKQKKLCLMTDYMAIFNASENLMTELDKIGASCLIAICIV